MQQVLTPYSTCFRSWSAAQFVPISGKSIYTVEPSSSTRVPIYALCYLMYGSVVQLGKNSIITGQAAASLYDRAHPYKNHLTARTFYLFVTTLSRLPRDVSGNPFAVAIGHSLTHNSGF